MQWGRAVACSYCYQSILALKATATGHLNATSSLARSALVLNYNEANTHSHSLTYVDGFGMCIKVRRQSQTEKHGKAQDKKISGRVQIHQLQVWKADSCDHTWNTNTSELLLRRRYICICTLTRVWLTKQSAEHSTQDGIRQWGEQSRELPDSPQQKHDACSVLHHPPTANLHTNINTRRVTRCQKRSVRGHMLSEG